MKPDDITNTNSEKTSLGNAELNLGHTTRFLPRQAEAFIDSGKNTHMGNSKLGGTTRFSSRHLSEWPYLTHEVPARTVPITEDQLRASFNHSEHYC